MAHTLFGTDGIRGVPGQYPLDAETIGRIGAATVQTLGARGRTMIAVRDTRESGPWITACLKAGVDAAGGTLFDAGVLPTPAAAYLVGSRAFAGAFVVSASHNPFPDNGIKVLTGDGEKASSEVEASIGADVQRASPLPPAPESADDRVSQASMAESYLAHVRTVLDQAGVLAGSRVALDCANGAMSSVGPRALEALGLDVVVGGATPDGRNINAQCGSTHPGSLQDVVRRERCRLGIAFDGDGDRAILVDADGRIVDGDATLLICARHLQSCGRLSGNGVVATVMSNIGLEIALKASGIVMHRCPVGDRQVREMMRKLGVVLGGEQSGHIIFSEFLPTGDGLITALSVLRAMRDTGRELADLASGLVCYPQVLLNVPVRDKPDLANAPGITEAIRSAEHELGDTGRVLVRYSGTEPLLRIMIEGPDLPVVQALAEAIAGPARAQLGMDRSPGEA